MDDTLQEVWLIGCMLDDGQQVIMTDPNGITIAFASEDVAQETIDSDEELRACGAFVFSVLAEKKWQMPPAGTIVQ